MAKPSPSNADLGAAVVAAVPEAGEIVAAAGGAPLYLVGGAVRDLLLGRWPRRPRPRRRGRPCRDRPAAGRRGRRARAVRDGEGPAGRARGRHRPRAQPRPTSAPGPCPRSARPESRRTLRVATSRSTRSRSRSARGPGRLLDPHGGLADLERGRAAGAARALVRDDPTRALRARALRRPARARARGRRPPSACAETDLGTVSGERVAAELGKLAAERDRPAGASSCSPAGALVDPAPGAGGADRAGRRSCSTARLGARSRAPERACSRPPAAAPARSSRPLAGDRPRSALGRGRGRPRADRGRARARPRRWAPSGWTTTWSAGARAARDHGRGPDRGRRAGGPGDRPRACAAALRGQARRRDRSAARRSSRTALRAAAS